MTKLPSSSTGTVARCYGFEVICQWWLHKPVCVMTNAAGTLMWDFTIATDGPVTNNRLDITVIDKTSGTVKFVVIAIRGDCRLRTRLLKRRKNILI